MLMYAQFYSDGPNRGNSQGREGGWQKEVPMSRRVRSQMQAQTPIERIFEKVMHRKMTSQERIYFHLEKKSRPSRRAIARKQPRAA